MDPNHSTVRRRFVVLVDGSEPRDEKKSTNQSNIQRTERLVHNGTVVAGHGREVHQTKQLYVAEKRAAFRIGDPTADLVKTIVRDVCQALTSPEDELYLFGSGHGAFVARAVAGVMYHMGLPKQAFLSRFDEIFEHALALIRARFEDDSRMGPKVTQILQEFTDDPPQIPFVGLFDTTKVATTKNLDISFVPPINVLRHALAMNETRSSKAHLGLAGTQDDAQGRSLVEAWFIGTHEDMCGGIKHDGLSLYPLQWILLESMKAGLQLSPLTTATPGRSENPLMLVFPQYAGSLPQMDGTETIEWRIPYVNGINISMYDLETVHALSKTTTGDDHALKLEPAKFNRKLARGTFDDNGLVGWNSNTACGTILHPSMFCILDRFPRYLDLASFKQNRKVIVDFQSTCTISENALPPWLQNVELQAHGVKAFRILVCGKTGVGKSTLINKVFGVELTEESQSYNQGVHDINEAFESPKHPGLLIHDSRGWQAGSNAELDLIAKFLRHRAFQKDPAEALHVIWFCVDSDVSRIEEADKRTFSTISEFSNEVPVFVVGTKKDKLTGYRSMDLLEKYMEETNDYKKAKAMARAEASRMADEQFEQLRSQLSQIEHYRADGYCCISKDDDSGVKDLLSQTLELIADERVRLFCVAAQVVDVEQKINAAITESMRLGTHAVRTAAVPLPFSGIIGTPTVSRLIVEHVLQCFGFPKTSPAEVEDVMKRVVTGNMSNFMKVGLTQTITTSLITLAVAIPTSGIGAVVGLSGCLLAVPPAARMLLKCSCDMILILERAFRYQGKYVSVKQIEEAARYYTTTTVKTFSGNEKRLQQLVHDEVDRLVPLKDVLVGWNFNKLRGGIEDIIYSCRFDKTNSPDSDASSSKAASRVELIGSLPGAHELDAGVPVVAELPGDDPRPTIAELYGSEPVQQQPQQQQEQEQGQEQEEQQAQPQPSRQSSVTSSSVTRSPMTATTALTTPSLAYASTHGSSHDYHETLADHPITLPRRPLASELEDDLGLTVTQTGSSESTTAAQLQDKGALPRHRSWKPSTWKLGRKPKSAKDG